MNSAQVFSKILLVIISFIITCFFVIPNILVLYTIIIGYNDTFFEFSIIDNIKQVLSCIYIQIYIRSALIGSIVLFLTILLAHPFACIIYSIQYKSWQRAIILITLVPFWTSSLARTYSIALLLKTHGIINQILLYLGLITSPINLLYSWTAIVIGLTHNLFPFMMLPIYLSLEKINHYTIEAAKDLGANYIQIFCYLLLPASYGGIIAGSSVVFLSSLSMFCVSDILGGARYILIGNLLKNHFLITNDWQLGCSIGLIFYVFIALFAIIQKNMK